MPGATARPASAEGDDVSPSRHLHADNLRLRERELSVADVAARLEMRLHEVPSGSPVIPERCARAVEAGLAAVACRPDQLPEVAPHVAGSSVVLVTALDWAHPEGVGLSHAAVVSRARRLADLGARDIVVVCSAASGTGEQAPALAARVEAIAETMADYAGHARVMLDTSGMDDAQVQEACRTSREAGAWLVQGGTWRGDRSGLSHVVLMREALGPDVLLKWTQPMRTLDILLVAMGEGVDRFNGDVDELLGEAAKRAQWTPLRIPVAGLDF